MPVLVAPAYPIPRTPSPFAVAIERWRLRLVLHSQWTMVLRRGDPRLLADTCMADMDSPEPAQYRPPDMEARHLHWML